MSSIARRIRRSLLGLALGLSIVFAGLSLLLLYVTEDALFARQLDIERDALINLPADERADWQPNNRHMSVIWSRTALPSRLQSVVGEKAGIYEQFDSDNAAFVLSGKLTDSATDSGQSYFLVYDVSDLLVVRQSRSVYLWVFAAGLIVVVVGAIVIALRLSHQSLRPLRQLTDRLQSDEAGDLPDSFAHAYRGDEIGILASGLETALKRVRASTRREFEFNRGVSHELRTPIQVAKNALEIVETGPVTESAATARALERLKRAVSEMEGITTAFLWMISGKGVDQTPVAAAEVFDQVITAHELLLTDLEVQCKIEPADLVYSVPGEILAVLIGNLLRNAAQHTEDGRIVCELTASRITITNRTPPEGGMEAGGFGVGLDIVQRICTSLGWELTLRHSEGQKTIATVAIPPDLATDISRAYSN